MRNYNVSGSFARLCVFIFFSFFIFSCVSQASKNDFYLALMNDSTDEKAALFEKALSNPNEYVRRYASEELAVLHMQGKNISRKTEELIKKEARGFWADVFDMTSGAGQNLTKERALSFLFNHDLNTASFIEARQYLLDECSKRNISFSYDEVAVMAGYNAVSRLQYNEALPLFRFFQEDGLWPQQMPELFMEHPGLINALGRTFVYTQTKDEGLVLFQQWAGNLPENMSNAPDILMDLRYRLNFYSARISRRIGGQGAKAVSLFEQALVDAPDLNQQDACIWYMLDSIITGPSAGYIVLLEKYVSKWHRGSYYNDIMERFLFKLISGREWSNVVKTFALIQNINTGNFVTSYAWVIARLIEYDYLSASDSRLAAQIANTQAADSSAYYRIAYDTGIIFSIPAFYYRALSADALELPFFELAEESADDIPASEYSQCLQFLLDFFNNGAADYSVSYLRAVEKDLTPGEIRVLAQVYDREGMYPQSMRLSTLYIYMDGYNRDRRNWELMFPRPFKELIELYADQYNFEPSLLYGLTRSESAFRSAVVSHAGAVGLMQLMPSTAKDTADRLRRAGGPDYADTDGSVDSTNPELNVHIGTFYFSNLMAYFNQETVLALMAYNGGQNRIRRLRTASRLPVDLFIETVPILETRDYGKRVLGAARVYQELYYGKAVNKE
ncbi:MAG: lytic transglycosylase domain-containing protein [Treponema sp.]|nr:lytic transglycosylase domain-containing protein [Treponema sp.]